MHCFRRSSALVNTVFLVQKKHKASCKKIQGTYFKIQAIYFKIYGLYFWAF